MTRNRRNCDRRREPGSEYRKDDPDRLSLFTVMAPRREDGMSVASNRDGTIAQRSVLKAQASGRRPAAAGVHGIGARRKNTVSPINNNELPCV